MSKMQYIPAVTKFKRDILVTYVQSKRKHSIASFNSFMKHLNYRLSDQENE